MQNNLPAKHIVITGSTRGIGLGLAEAFLDRGCSLTISGRSSEAVSSILTNLSSNYDPSRILGQACDVRQYDQVVDLWHASHNRYSQVDIWINNAGLSGPQTPIWQHSPQMTRQVIETNILGVMHGSMVAMQGMMSQGYGALYNMEGMGSDGRMHKGLGLYGTSKYALKYYTDSLVAESKGTPLVIGALRPGMVITNMVKSQYEGQPEEWEKIKRIFNIIAERVDVVTPWLADRILANTQTGRRISFMTTGRMLKRMLSLPFKKRDVFN